MRSFRIILVIILIVSNTAVFAGIKEDIAKTVVRVKSNNKYSTGFFWKDGNTIMTTLHSLGSTNNIEVLIPGIGSSKRVTLLKVYKHADLVLLRLTSYTSLSFISDKYLNKPAVDTKVFTIGYNGGSSSYIDRDFTVGLMQGSTLKNLLPTTSARREIETLGFPALEVQITYLQGNLLHGFSGSPIVDMRGKLVGIADGGLENGAAAISWCVNSSHITNLENSNEGAPNLNTTKINTLFAYEDYEGEDNEEETIFEINSYSFKKIKTRTFSQLDLTGNYSSPDGMSLNQLLNVFSNFNYRDFSYDIYLEKTTGATIVVPEGDELTEEGGFIVAGNEKIKYYISLEESTNVQMESLQFEANVMPDFNTKWVPDLAWTYPMPFYGANNTIIRRKAYFGNYGHDYLFETLAANKSSFLGVAAIRDNSQYITPADGLAWAKYAIGIQLCTYSN